MRTPPIKWAFVRGNEREKNFLVVAGVGSGGVCGLPGDIRCDVYLASGLIVYSGRWCGTFSRVK